LAVGIWATDGSEFRGEALIKGQGLYLDVDGIGAMVGGDGSDVLGARIVVTAYNESTNILNIDITENGKVLFRSNLVYDPVQKAIVSPKDQNRIYHKRLNSLSPDIRKSLGLEPRTNGLTLPDATT
jgi:hypothetical protein